jgi:Glycosyl transferases group 1
LPRECCLAVVGNAQQIAGVQDEVAALRLADRVFFLGALDHVDIAYQAADCLAHPTLEDTFAMVVLEAMAYGLPVVVSDTRFCGIAELLTDQVNALILANPGDAAALAQALSRVLFDAPTRTTLSDAGGTFASQHQWTQSAQKQDRIYRHAAGLHSRQVLLLDAGRKRLNAGPKARLDTATFLSELGFEVVTVPQSRSRHVRKWIGLYLRYLSNMDLPRNAVVWSQFPPESTTRIVIEQARQRGLQTVAFIHDVEGLKPDRPNWERVREELEEVRKYTKVLSLNKKISAILQSHGIDAAAELECWDYHCERAHVSDVPADGPFKVVYAGNLSSYKSGFIYQLGAFPSVQFVLFGQGLNSGYALPDNIRFEGAFNPDTPPQWAGKYFGLIWDGESTGACDGNYGAYLAFNTPHKAALYLSRNMPVIVWREACIAALINEHHAGLLVSSLNELEHRLAALTLSEYQAMKRGATALGDKIRSGYFIKRAALKVINSAAHGADQMPAKST